MTRGMLEAWSTPNVTPWIYRAVAFRHAADSAKGFRADPFLIKNLRSSMRMAAYKARAELLIARMDRRTAA